jgi:carbon storage regulator
VGELISIGDSISIRVMGVDGNFVRLGVKAPYSIGVYRSEIYERIQREKLEENKSVE